MWKQARRTAICALAILLYVGCGKPKGEVSQANTPDYPEAVPAVLTASSPERIATLATAISPVEQISVEVRLNDLDLTALMDDQDGLSLTAMKPTYVQKKVDLNGVERTMIVAEAARENTSNLVVTSENGIPTGATLTVTVEDLLTDALRDSTTEGVVIMQGDTGHVVTRPDLQAVATALAAARLPLIDEADTGHVTTGTPAPDDAAITASAQPDDAGQAKANPVATTPPAVAPTRPDLSAYAKPFIGDTDPGYFVRLDTFGDRKIPVIKAFRSLSGFGLKEAKATVERAPYYVAGKMSKAEAEHWREVLETAGATVTVQPPNL